MRWLLKVSAEKRKSSTGSGVTRLRHGTSAGAGSRFGAWLRSPAFTSSRKTVRRSSSSAAAPSAPSTRLLTVAKTSVPVPPLFTERSASTVSRRTLSPTRNGRRKRTRSPANMRRGSGIGGTTPVSRGLPSGRSSAVATRGRK